MRQFLILTLLSRVLPIHLQEVREQPHREPYTFFGSNIELAFFGALGFYKPQPTATAVQVNAEAVMDWLASPEGSVWLEACAADVQDISHALAIMYSPTTLYGSGSDSVARVGMGLVHRPPSCKQLSFPKRSRSYLDLSMPYLIRAGLTRGVLLRELFC